MTEHFPIPTGTNIALVPSGSASIAKVKVSRAVGEGIKALQVAFPLMSQTPEDRAIAMKLYAEAVEGFHSSVQEFALRWLRLHNPRNTPTFTQPPTAQDVHECCEHVLSTWRRRSVAHFVGYSTNRGIQEFLSWGDEPISYRSSAIRNPLPWGGEPFSETSYIPDEIIIDTMRKVTSYAHQTDDLVNMPAEHFARLRPEFFVEGRKAEIDSKRQAKAEAEEKARKEQEYLDGLSPDLRRARTEVARRYWRLTNFDESKMPGEEQLISEAKELLTLEAEARAKRDAEWKADCECRAQGRLHSGSETQSTQ